MAQEELLQLAPPLHREGLPAVVEAHPRAAARPLEGRPVEREVDQVLGGLKLTVSTLGKALAPKIPAMFSDVILTERNGDKWAWNVASSTADVKTRNLPLRSDLSPSFAQILDKWIARNASGLQQQAEVAPSS